MAEIVERFRVGGQNSNGAILGHVGRRYDTTDHILVQCKGCDLKLNTKEARELHKILGILMKQVDTDDQTEATYLSLGLDN